MRFALATCHRQSSRLVPTKASKPFTLRWRRSAPRHSEIHLTDYQGEQRPGGGRDEVSPEATHLRDNSLATSMSSDASDASRKPDDMDDLDATGSIYTFCTRLRALSGVSRVVVRVHSGALKVLETRRFRSHRTRSR